MKNFTLFIIIISGILLYSCSKEEEEVILTPYQMLTGNTWHSDSLLADGEDASGPGELLEKFKGEAHFRTDGTGTFGEYSGEWTLSEDNSEITIITTEMPLPITAIINELTQSSLKITTGFPDASNPGEVIIIRMTFIAI